MSDSSLDDFINWRSFNRAEYNKKYYRANQNHYRDWRKQHAKEHREYIRSPKQRAKAKEIFHSEEYKQKRFAYRMKVEFGITVEEFNEVLIRQNGLCAICGVKFQNKRKKGPHVDHDHRTGKIRGLLCNSCNLAVGRYEAHKDGIDAYLSKQVEIYR
jgi:hypothetical protein